MTTSDIFNIILGLLLVFQWFWDRAREQAVKNNIFAIRRMIAGLLDHEDEVVVQKGKDLTESIDATLATLDARPPLKERIARVVSNNREINKLESAREITVARNEKI